MRDLQELKRANRRVARRKVRDLKAFDPLRDGYNHVDWVREDGCGRYRDDNQPHAFTSRKPWECE